MPVNYKLTCNRKAFLVIIETQGIKTFLHTHVFYPQQVHVPASLTPINSLLTHSTGIFSIPRTSIEGVEKTSLSLFETKPRFLDPPPNNLALLNKTFYFMLKIIGSCVAGSRSTLLSLLVFIEQCIAVEFCLSYVILKPGL